MNRKQTYNLICKVAIFTALSYILYFIKFPLTFIFPSFLEIQFSNVPAFLGGFVLGPFGGILITVIRCLFKLLSTHTAGIGEIADLLIGLFSVGISSLYYQKHKTKKGGIIALIIGFIIWNIAACIINATITLPFYIDKFYGGVDGYINALSPYISLTMENYLWLSVLAVILPFNLLLSFVVVLITFLVYKKVSNIFKKDFIK